MSSIKKYIALDIGAESGRAIVGHFDGKKIELEEMYRFPNEPVYVSGTLHWDVLRIFHEIKNGLRACVKKFGAGFAGIGIDTWGVDFGLLAADGTLLSNPVHYRDARTVGIPEKVSRIIPRQRLFEITGAPSYDICSIFQLYSMKLKKSPILENAATFLMMPDLLSYFLTGQKSCERTNACMTQLMDTRKGAWSKEIFDKLGLPIDIMPRINKPGTVLAGVLAEVAGDVGLCDVPVIAVASHDTASAAAAVPGDGDFAFISSGTWSVPAVLIDEPVTNEEAFKGGYADEITLGGYFFAMNVIGLWLVQELRRKWTKEGQAWDYSRLTDEARKARPFVACIDPNDQRFLAPEDMEEEIAAYCRDTNQPVPETKGEMVRTVLESLAFSYRYYIDDMCRILGREIKSVNIVGGGIQNTLLCQLTASACRVPVIAGPIEATSSGNVLIQALALGDIAGADDIRTIVKSSYELANYAPQDADLWEEKYQEYLKTIGKAD